jgi:hypothetical protein
MARTYALDKIMAERARLREAMTGINDAIRGVEPPCAEPPKVEAPQPRRGGWPKGKPRKPRQ